MLEDRVMIRQVEAPKEFTQGIAMPESAKEKHRLSEGTVVAVGPGLMNDNTLLRKILKFMVWSFGWKSKWSTQSATEIPVPKEFTSPQTMSVKVDDYVRYGAHAGTKVSHGGEDFIIVRQMDIFYIDDEGKKS